MDPEVIPHIRPPAEAAKSRKQQAVAGVLSNIIVSLVSHTKETAGLLERFRILDTLYMSQGTAGIDVVHDSENQRANHAAMAITQYTDGLVQLIRAATPNVPKPTPMPPLPVGTETTEA